MVKEGKKYKIVGFNCGYQCSNRFSCMGILVGKEIKIQSIQPFHGPVTISIGDNVNIAIGQGMFSKLELEEINE